MDMAGFVPKDKMSKKSQKELNRQRRKTWEFSPVTKVTESRKVYNRKRKAHDILNWRNGWMASPT